MPSICGTMTRVIHSASPPVILTAWGDALPTFPGHRVTVYECDETFSNRPKKPRRESTSLPRRRPERGLRVELQCLCHISTWIHLFHTQPINISDLCICKNSVPFRALSFNCQTHDLVDNFGAVEYYVQLMRNYIWSILGYKPANFKESKMN